jgi:hypothetical protein
MATVTINVAGLEALAERLQSLAQNLPEMLMDANEKIVVATETAIADLYPNMQSRWRVTINDSPGEVASVRAVGSQAIIKWYEYGTPAHPIDPVVGMALAFPGTHGSEGEFVIRGHVDHPGAKAHNEKEILMANMKQAGWSAWSSALADIVTYL